MPRKQRLKSKIGIYHVITRGNNKEDLFIDNADRIFFLNLIFKFATDLSISIYAYCLMSNHVHLLIGNADEKLETLMKKTDITYAQFFNHKYQRSGHVFQDRYKSKPIESIEYFQEAIRYIICNPDKSKISSYKTYRWNSYRKTMKKDNSIDVDFILFHFKTLKNFDQYLKEKSNSYFFHPYSAKRPTDEECIKLLIENYRLSSQMNLSDYTKQERLLIISELKRKGFTINQISRITNINRNIIQRA